MFDVSSKNNLFNDNPELAELVQHSSKVLARETSSWRSPEASEESTCLQQSSDWQEQGNGSASPAIDSGFAACSSYAVPLMPLRERDEKVLVDLFSQDEIETIEADIAHNLLQRCPEPCWEDEPFHFLREYL